MMADLRVKLLPTSALEPDPHNARKHSREQIRAIAASIEQLGFNNPILIDGQGRIIAGHARHDAALLLGLLVVPTICLAHLNEAEQRAYLIADNRLAERASWDVEILKSELAYLDSTEVTIDATLTGFDDAEIDILLSDRSEDNEDSDEVELPSADDVAVSQAGDLWALGDHRLLCGSALEATSYAQFLGDTRPAMTFTDPPYNVPIAGHVRIDRRDRHREFAMASGEMTKQAFTDFLAQSLKMIAAASHDGALHFVCMDWRHVGELVAATHAAGLELKNLCIWVKNNAGMGSLYRSQHELVFVLKQGQAPHINNVELGRHGRHRSNVWHYAGVNTFRRGRARDLEMHPTVKPVAMVADAMRDCSRRHDIVLDPFCGSGTTIIAAEMTDRVARCIELDPLYVDTAIRRWQQLTGKDACLLRNGMTFADAITSRSSPSGSPSPATLNRKETDHAET